LRDSAGEKVPLKLSKDVGFYRLLESQARVAVRAAQEFHALSQDFSDLEASATRMEEIEHEGDRLTHELQNKVTSTFITPIDKEDLRDLSQSLDDVTDYIEAAAARASLYRLDVPRPDLATLSELLVRATEVTADAVAELQHGFNRESIKEKLKEIHTLENASDTAFRSSLAALFAEPGIDPLYVIKWKEMYDRIETAVDKCEDIAKVLGTMLVKYS
jgi:predicted phosphate transport protein (TIGR00153 family)